jgi:NAD(P)-dependent dehydrogenase (short-subunit alcohol dehydrogenase family)
MRFDEQVAVVTGAAHGLGAAIARGLAREGAAVALVDVDGVGLSNEVEAIKSSHGRALAIPADVAKTSDVRRVFDRTLEEYARVDILVNNAGILQNRNFDRYTMTDWNRQLDANLKSAFFCLQRAAQIMVPVGRGRIVSIASTSAYVASTVPHAAYDASKAGIRQMTVSAAAELGPFGVRVNAVAPGTILTELNQERLAGMDAQQMGTYLRRIPLRRLGNPIDVVGPVLFLCSSESEYVTGHTLVVDGGWLTN